MRQCAFLQNKRHTKEAKKKHKHKTINIKNTHKREKQLPTSSQQAYLRNKSFHYLFLLGPIASHNLLSNGNRIETLRGDHCVSGSPNAIKELGVTCGFLVSYFAVSSFYQWHLVKQIDGSLDSYLCFRSPFNAYIVVYFNTYIVVYLQYIQSVHLIYLIELRRSII